MAWSAPLVTALTNAVAAASANDTSVVTDADAADAAAANATLRHNGWPDLPLDVFGDALDCHWFEFSSPPAAAYTVFSVVSCLILAVGVFGNLTVTVTYYRYEKNLIRGVKSRRRTTSKFCTKVEVPSSSGQTRVLGFNKLFRA